jgi:hypothetical protein
MLPCVVVLPPAALFAAITHIHALMLRHTPIVDSATSALGSSPETAAAAAAAAVQEKATAAEV